MTARVPRHAADRKSNVLLYTGAAIVFGVYLPVTVVWSFSSRDGETDPSTASISASETVGSSPQIVAQPPLVTQEILNRASVVSGALMAAVQPSPVEQDRSENGDRSRDASVDVDGNKRQNPTEAVPTRPARWMPDPSQLTTLTEAELKRELESSAAELELYDRQFHAAGSYDDINKEVDSQKKVREEEIRNHRKAAEKFPAGPLQTDSTRIQGSGNNAIARIESSTLTPQQRQAIHEASPRFDPLQNWRQSRTDLAGLPFIDGDDCRLDFEAADVLRRRSSTIGRLGSMPGDGNSLTLSYLSNQQDWQAADIPALVQMLQIKSPLVRSKLTQLLAGFPDRAAARALAHRALYDTNARVRNAAITGLTTRTSEEYLTELIEGFRYPWPRVAEHAADALVKLKATDAIASLEALLDAPDPRAPFQTADGQWAVHELVRLNHMKNCYLCHAPSLSRLDTVRGVVPSPYEPIPAAYYDDPKGYFVRADVTYLRQDFSVVHDVTDTAPWPDEQRFDYLVRERRISDPEAKTLLTDLSDGAPSYPQRNSVLYALHKLHAAKPH